MVHADAGIARQHLGGQVRNRAHADTGIADLAGIGLGSLDQILQAVEGRSGRSDDRTRRVDDVGDRGEVLGRRKTQRFMHIRRDRHRADRQHAQGMAVWLRPGQGLRADVAARTRPVLDHDGLAQRVGHFLGQFAGH